MGTYLVNGRIPLYEWPTIGPQRARVPLSEICGMPTNVWIFVDLTVVKCLIAQVIAFRLERLL